MNKENKQKYIKEMTTQFDKSEAVIVAHYQGLTVNQLDKLRAKMREHGIIFKITKNRITKIALEKTRCKELSNLFTGPTAVALSKDAITSAKILTNFSKENSNLKILGPKGLMPNPKLGTVTDDLKKAILDAKLGQVEIKNDKDGNIGLSLGKKSFSDDKVVKNFTAVLEVLEREKGNQTLKGDLIKSAFLTSTMGVSYKLKLPKNI